MEGASTDEIARCVQGGMLGYGWDEEFRDGGRERREVRGWDDREDGNSMYSEDILTSKGIRGTLHTGCKVHNFVGQKLTTYVE